MKTQESLKSWMKDMKKPELIFLIRWSSLEERKTKDTQILKTNSKTTEEQPLKPLTPTLRVSPISNLTNLTYKLKSSATKTQSIKRKMSRITMLHLRNRLKNILSLKLICKMSLRMLLITFWNLRRKFIRPTKHPLNS